MSLISLVDNRMHHEALLNPKHKAYHVVSFDLTTCQLHLPDEVEVAIAAFLRAVQKHYRAKAGGRESARSTNGARQLLPTP